MTSRLAIVTGAAFGIGRSITKHLLGEGLRVVGIDIRPPSPFDTRRWTGFACDVIDERAWVEAMAGIVRDLGAPDVLVNAAGMLRAEPAGAGIRRGVGHDPAHQSHQLLARHASCPAAHDGAPERLDRKHRGARSEATLLGRGTRRLCRVQGWY